MKKTETNGINRLRKCLSLLVVSLLYKIQLLAAPEDHGRWYSVDDSGSSSHSPAFYVIIFIISAICVGFLIITTLNDDKHSKSDKGCITTFFLILLLFGFLGVMKACS